MPEDNSSYGEILPIQMRLFWQKACEGFINRDVFQAFLNNVGAFTVPRGMYYNFSDSQKKAAKIMGHNYIGINLVINALQWKGVAIRLTENDLDKYATIPFSEKKLREIADKKWRDKRAVLWWAPPEQYGFTLKKLFDIFGSESKYQPCFEKDTWWINEDFAQEIIPEGWHLTLVELPVEMKSRTFEEQISLKENCERLCHPAELAFLSFMNLIVNREYILRYFYTRTDTKIDSENTISIGKFGAEGLNIDRTSSTLSTQDTAIGLLLSYQY